MSIFEEISSVLTDFATQSEVSAKPARIEIIEKVKKFEIFS